MAVKSAWWRCWRNYAVAGGIGRFQPPLSTVFRPPADCGRGRNALMNEILGGHAPRYRVDNVAKINYTLYY